MTRRGEFLKIDQNTMIAVKEPILKISQKLDILRHIFSDKPITPLFEGLGQSEIAAFKNFVWDKTIEFGIRVRGKSFSKEELLIHIKNSHPSKMARETNKADPKHQRQIEAICKIAKGYIKIDSALKWTSSQGRRIKST